MTIAISGNKRVTAIQYGWLEYILACALPKDPFLEVFLGRTLLLALITPCKTKGHDTVKEMTTYSIQLALIVTDLQSVQVVVGSVHSQGLWTIINHPDTFADTLFASRDNINEDDDDDLM